MKKEEVVKKMLSIKKGGNPLVVNNDPSVLMKKEEVAGKMNPLLINGNIGQPIPNSSSTPALDNGPVFIKQVRDALPHTQLFQGLARIQAKGFEGVKENVQRVAQRHLARPIEEQAAFFAGIANPEPIQAVGALKGVIKPVVKKVGEGVPKIFKGLAQHPLAQEASKYKTAEEFVKAQQPVYRGVEKGVTDFQPSSNGRFSKSQAFSITTDPVVAKNYGEYGNTINGFLGQNAKIKVLGKDIANTQGNLEAEITKARAEGYDAIKAAFMGNDEIIILNKSSIKTKSQLTDIYNKSKANPANYKTAEEFVKAQESKYKGVHEAPTRADGDSVAPAYALDKIYPADIYSSKATQYYSSGMPYDAETISILQSIKGKPNATISVYRAVPGTKTNAEVIAGYEAQKRAILKNGKIPDKEMARKYNLKDSSAYYDFIDNEMQRLKGASEPNIEKYAINEGDWVTPNRKYAVDHGMSNLSGNYKILSKKVRADELFTDANSIQEFGYSPRESKIPTKSQLTEIWNKAVSGIDPEVSSALREAKGLSASDIVAKHPDINLKREVTATDIHGKKVVIPEGEALTPYELKGNKVLLQDGETYIVSKNQYANIKGQSVSSEAKPFAPELEGTEETVLSRKFPNNEAGMTQEERAANRKNIPYEDLTKYSSYQLPEGKNYKEVLIKAPQKARGQGEPFASVNSADQFKSSHFPEDPNTGAWNRFNDRTYQGKKVKFWEESQDIFSETDKIKYPERYAETEKFVNEKFGGRSKLMRMRVESALITAVNDGADILAWTTGEQQIARYSLGKEVEKIEWNNGQVQIRPKDSSKDINVYFDKQGKILKTDKPEWMGKYISDVIPKGLADEIMKADSGALSGEGLNIGGESKINLYDKQIKSIVEDLTGGKVEMMDMGLPVSTNSEKFNIWNTKEKISGKDLTPQNIKVGLEIGSSKGGANYIITDVLGDGKFEAVNKTAYERYNALPDYRKAEAESGLLHESETFDISVKLSKGQQGIRITPEIRAKILGEAPKLKKPSGLPIKPSLPRTPTSASGARGGIKIDDFESRIGEPTTEKNPDFKLYQKVEDLIRKYAVRVGEGYTEGNAGLFYHNTQTIRLNGMNNLSVAAHEITHRLDMLHTISKKLMEVTGYSINGKPLYARETAPLRKELTAMYVNNYPGASAEHPLKKRMVEGYATLLQKYVEAPITTTQNYPNLVREMLLPEGKYYKPVIGEIIADLKGIVTEYQGLSALDKIGARVTSDVNETGKESFLNPEERIRTEVSDEIFLFEKLSEQAGTKMTDRDLSLIIRRQRRGATSLFSTNTLGKHGYWSFNEKGAVKLYDFNWKTLQESLSKKQILATYGNYLVARDDYFTYKEIDQLAAEYKETKDEETGKLLQDLRSQVANDGSSKEVSTKAYLDGKDNFVKEDEMFDKLVRPDLDLLHRVGLITDAEYENLTSREGYASKMRETYDQIIGDESPRGKGISGPRPKSLKHRKGSQRTIINPVASAIKNHPEILRKATTQMVYNEIVKLAQSNKFPDLFQVQSLRVIPDKETGAFIYPQERDPNIVMGRINGKRVPVLMDGELKKALGDILDFQNIDHFGKVLASMSRSFTKGTTSAFPPFALANLIIDQISAWAQSLTGYVPFFSPVKMLFKRMLNRTGPEAQFAQEYLAVYGTQHTMAGSQDMSAHELADFILKERKGLLKVMDFVEKGFDILSIPSQLSETATRMVEYIHARMAGDSQMVAGIKAERVTTAFGDRGRMGGSQILKGGVRAIPFLNVGIQVLAQTYRSLVRTSKKSSRRFLMVMAAITAAQIASFMLMNSRATKKQKDGYVDLSSNELSKYIWVASPNGETLQKYRIPEFLSMPGTVINMMLAEKMMDANYSKWDYMDASTSFIPTQLNPLHPMQALLSMIPWPFKPLFMVATNTKDFPKIRPMEGLGQQNKPVAERMNEGTTPVAKWIGSKLPERFNLSPIKVDYLISGAFGRLGNVAAGNLKALNPIRKESYFTSGRRVQEYYDRKEHNDQQYSKVNNNPKSLTFKERATITREHWKLNAIENTIELYRKVDEKKDPLRTEKLRNKILKDISQL